MHFRTFSETDTTDFLSTLFEGGNVYLLHIWGQVLANSIFPGKKLKWHEK
jgi:hypothetical protein